MIEPEALLRLPAGAGAPRFSPDGTRLAYEEGGSAWVVPVGDAEGSCDPREVGPGRAVRWHPSGDALTAVRVDGGRGLPRVWRLPLGPAPAAPLSPQGIAVRDYALAPDRRTLALLEADVPRVVLEGRAVRFRYPAPGALWLVDLVTGEVRRRAELPPDEAPARPSLSWSPDGRYLVWETLRFPEGRQENSTELRLLEASDAGGGPPRRVLPVGACETRLPAAPGAAATDSAGLWRPDGGALALAASPTPYGVANLTRLAIWRIGSGVVRYLAPDTAPAFGAAWAPDGRTLYAALRDGGATERLYAVDPATGVRRALIAPQIGAERSGALAHPLSHHQAPAVSPDGRLLACVAQEPDRLPEVWLVATDGTAARPVTAANRRLDAVPRLRRLTASPVRWWAPDGLELEGLVLYPPAYGPDRPPPGPLPTIVDVHGGPNPEAPRRRLGDDPLQFTGLHFLAEHGYLCFAVDYRSAGNAGWAPVQRLLEAGDAVATDAADVLAGVEYLVTAGLADPARLGLRGFSHGAFLVNWLVTQTGRFGAAASHEGPTDLGAFPFPNSSVEVRFGGAPADVPERYRRASAVAHAAGARTPLLLTEGAESATAPLGQGAAFRDALRATGADVEHIVYPGEGHSLSRPEHQADYLRRTLDWFDRYLRGTGGRPAGLPPARGSSSPPRPI